MRSVHVIQVILAGENQLPAAIQVCSQGYLLAWVERVKARHPGEPDQHVMCSQRASVRWPGHICIPIVIVQFIVLQRHQVDILHVWQTAIVIHQQDTLRHLRLDIIQNV